MSNSVQDSLSIIFFQPDDTSWNGRITACGRKFVTCGLLFHHSYDPKDRTKFKIELFYASVERCFKWHDNFYFYEGKARVDGYLVSSDNLMVQFVTSENDMMDKVYRLCRALPASIQDFNSRDRIMSSIIPFYTPPDVKDIFNVECLHSAQAVILILRECLTNSNPIKERVRGLNSRTATPDSLVDALWGLDAPHEVTKLMINSRPSNDPIPTGHARYEPVSMGITRGA